MRSNAFYRCDRASVQQTGGEVPGNQAVQTKKHDEAELVSLSELRGVVCDLGSKIDRLRPK
jgi:hypothetical protein